jgi:DNA-binding Lrp family transcriptional regulator
MDAVDRRLIEATQGGLPLVPEPYRAVGEAIGLEGDEVERRLRRLLSEGVVRRIGLVPNHYALGYRANGMAVWDVADDQVGELGRRVGALEFVTHCYRRPRRLPHWPYNLFSMVHGKSRQEVEEKVAHIATLLGPACAAHEVLYSEKILKKTGLRLGPREGE